MKPDPYKTLATHSYKWTTYMRKPAPYTQTHILNGIKRVLSVWQECCTRYWLGDVFAVFSDICNKTLLIPTPWESVGISALSLCDHRTCPRVVWVRNLGKGMAVWINLYSNRFIFFPPFHNQFQTQKFRFICTHCKFHPYLPQNTVNTDTCYILRLMTFQLLLKKK